MPKTEAQIDSLTEVNRQLRREGAHDQIISLARDLSKGQWGSSDDDIIGATKLALDAAAKMIAVSPHRPKCCLACDLAFIQKHMEVLLSRYLEETLEGKAR